MAHWNTAFVTGGGSGIGQCLSRKLLAEGTSVAIFDRSGDAAIADALQPVAQRAGARCRVFRADVADPAALRAAVDEAVGELGPPGLALNCAGIQNAKLFLALADAEFERMVMVNLMGSRNFAAAVLPHMKPGGRLALMASLAGLVPSYSYSAYNATKFGVVGLAGALRLDCIEQGVEVSVICPPEIDTPMVVEERKTITATGAKLKDTAGSLALEPACDYMLRQLKAGRYEIIPGFRARGVAFMSRLFPGVFRRISERIVAEGVRKETSHASS
ncbi:MAG: short-chain dehydrogenase [Halioglobus sp.]|nr:short-chain dehydrogenase [Halioglobus sp.]|tara:strand:- start:2042 stop:2863 length:822 start_codon:yes stop_codon:yes gene_type:complete